MTQLSAWCRFLDVQTFLLMQYRKYAMPIKIPDRLPAAGVLSEENIFVMTESRATHQDIRPLRVLLLNLMPKKIETEIQLMRMLSNSPLQVDVDLLRIDDRESKNTPKAHLDTFYHDFAQVKHNRYDGLIITGAPLGLTQFADVVYWDTLVEIIEWSRQHVTSTLFLCWAAQAALKVLYGLEKQTREVKLSGVYEHCRLVDLDPLVRGFDEVFYAPHSRHTGISREDVLNCKALRILAESDEAGPFLMSTENGRQIFVTGHPEYEWDTLLAEYQRDVSRGLDVPVPRNYFPGDNPNLPPVVNWRAHANLFFANWLNFYVYQETPYELESIGASGRGLRA